MLFFGFNKDLLCGPVVLLLESSGFEKTELTADDYTYRSLIIGSFTMSPVSTRAKAASSTPSNSFRRLASAAMMCTISSSFPVR